MPVSGVGGGAGAHWSDGLDEGTAAGGVPERDSGGAEVDVVGEVVPGVGHELCAPFGDTADIPAEQVVGRTGFARDEAVLEFREVALKKSPNVKLDYSAFKLRRTSKKAIWCS